MRLDKYLKVSRIIKRRSVAKDACDTGRVTLNGRIAKAGAEVEPGDTLCVHFGSSDFQVRVLDVSENVRKEAASDMYEVIA